MYEKPEFEVLTACTFF